MYFYYMSEKKRKLSQISEPKEKEIILVWNWALGIDELHEEINDYLEKGYVLHGKIFKFKKLPRDHCSCGRCVYQIGHDAYGQSMVKSSVKVLDSTEDNSESSESSESSG